MILFLCGSNKIKFPDSTLKIEHDKPELIDSADLVIATQKGLKKVNPEKKKELTDKLLYVSDKKDSNICCWKLLSEEEFSSLSPGALKLYVENLRYKNRLQSLESDLNIQEFLHDELLYKQEEFDAVQKIALFLSSDRPFNERLKEISKIILNFFKLKNGIFILRENLLFKVVYNSSGLIENPFSVNRGSFIDWICKNKMPLVVKNISDDLRFKGRQEITFMNFPVLATPVINKHGDLPGIFFFFSNETTGNFSKTFVEQINTFFSNVTPLIENAVIKEELERMNKIKNEFLANMTHELKTPLNGIIGFADILLLDDLTGEQCSHAMRIKESGTHLLSLINNILDMTKLESNEFALNYSEISIQKIINDTINSLIPEAKKKHIEIVKGKYSDLPGLSYGDATKTKQILLNLLSNSIKFTEKGRITLSVYTEYESDDYYKILFSIEDTGIGIPQEKLSEIFEPFKQADGSTTRKHGGTGLGLSISKKLIELHGGEIKVTSSKGQGTTFTFTINLLKSAPG